MRCLSRLLKQRHSQANWEYIQTLSLCVGEIVLNVWGATYLLCNEELVRERHERIVKGRFLSVNSTHSFPWRAASSPPWPCPVYCLPRSFCGTSDSSMYINATLSSFRGRQSVTSWAKKMFQSWVYHLGNTNRKLVLLKNRGNRVCLCVISQNTRELLSVDAPEGCATFFILGYLLCTCSAALVITPAVLCRPYSIGWLFTDGETSEQHAKCFDPEIGWTASHLNLWTY